MRSHSLRRPDALKVGDTAILDESAIVARIQAGDAPAFEAVFHRYYSGLHAFARSYVGSDDRAEDVVQDVFFTVWVQHETWAPRTPLVSYFYAAVRNRALNTLRRDAVVDRHVARGVATGQAERVDTLQGAQELDSHIRRTIEQLPPQCRQVFTMNREYGLSYSEIAAALGVSVKTVESHIGRALVAFRRSLRDWLP